MTQLGENIKRIRGKRDMTQRDLAALIHRMHVSHLSRIENGIIQNPGNNVVKEIADALGVKMDELNR